MRRQQVEAEPRGGRPAIRDRVIADHERRLRSRPEALAGRVVVRKRGTGPDAVYFCSAGCAAAYDADPGRYAEAAATAPGAATR